MQHKLRMNNGKGMGRDETVGDGLFGMSFLGMTDPHAAYCHKRAESWETNEQHHRKTSEAGRFISV